MKIFSKRKDENFDDSPSMKFSRGERVLKLWRFFKIYGVVRTWFKVAARRRGILPVTWRSLEDADIAIVGCGQYAYATIGFFVSMQYGARFRWCFDPNISVAEGFRRDFRVKHGARVANEWLSDSAVRFVYIASNHSTHADYACSALEKSLTVYIEKPIAVTETQLVQLERARRRVEADGKPRLFAGYNRPFSAAIRDFKVFTELDRGKPLSLSCFVSGHKLGSEHWYRNSGEGTRICGNAGHWIDLFVHLCGRTSRANEYKITMLSANSNEPDDNFALSISTERGDIFSLMLTARSEPFEGIGETLNLQQGEAIAELNDFKQLTVRKGSKIIKKRYWPKDVGHEKAILQPFSSERSRCWDEVIDSSILILAITEMVRSGTYVKTIEISEQRSYLFDEPSLH